MLADELIAVHEQPREIAPFSERHPGLTPESGYEAAAALHRHRVSRGWKPVGRKIGFTNRTIWARYGVYEPIWGTVYDRTMQYAEENEASVPLDGLVQPRIEPEICFGLKAAPQAESLIDAIEWVAHSVEIVQCHHPAWKVTLPDCTADNGLHGRLVVGERVPASRLPGLAQALPRVSVVLKKDAGIVDRGVGENVLGSPLIALGHLVGVLAKQAGAERLRAGDLVTTGVITDAHPVAPGESWSTEITGLALPGLRVCFR